MKWSRYNKRDIGKMILKMSVIVVLLAGIILTALYLGAKYAIPKVETFIAELEQKKIEQEKQKEDELLAQQLNNMNTENTEQQEELISEDDIISNEDIEIIEMTEETSENAIHRYEYVQADCSWLEAMANCKDKGGYLVNINSQQEYDYIVNEIESKNMQKIIFYLGASRDDGEDYYWINDDNERYGNSLNNDDNEWAYGQWLQGEPSYYDGDLEEPMLSMFYYEDEKRWVFNDIPENILENYSYYSGKLGYICEFDE